MIDQIGEGVRDDQTIGTPVIAIVHPKLSLGAQAEYIVAPAESVVRAPVGIPSTAAASFLMNALTAKMAINALGLAPGSTLLVTGAAGAVGGFAVQLAKIAGLTVIADASEADRSQVASFGADVIVSRGQGLATRVRESHPGGVDGVVDTIALHNAITPAVRDNGVAVSALGFSNSSERGVQWRYVLVHDGLKDTDTLMTLRDNAASGDLTLRVAATMPAEQVADAHRLIEAGGLRGRPVLTF